MEGAIEGSANDTAAGTVKVLKGRHWIGGTWREGRDAFDLRQRIAPFECIGTWPRTDESLMVEALEASRTGREAWVCLSAPEREACLRRVLDHLRADRSWSDHLASWLGIRPVEIESELFALDAMLDGRSGEFAPVKSGESDESVAVLFAHWTDLVSGLFRRVTEQLKCDRGVVLISDSRWPAGADAIAGALSAAGMPEGVVSLLHGVESHLHDKLLGVTSLEQANALDSSSPPDEALPGETLDTSDSDAGSLTLSQSSVRYTLDLGGGGRGNRTLVVSSGDDPKHAAEEALDRAFGRASTFSGQRPSRVSRVICHARLFSSFCQHLVSAVESSSDVQNPIPLIDADALSAVRTLWNLGLDEGATLIFGGETLETVTGSRHKDQRVLPAIFTNVEPEMSIGRFREPAPVLCLLRAETDAIARDLARDLD